jgi:hypothetical protein
VVQQVFLVAAAFQVSLAGHAKLGF